jgi:hypothetical protein
MNLKKLVKLLPVFFFLSCGFNLIQINKTYRDVSILSEARIIREIDYEILQKEVGEHSQFYFLYIFPVTPHLNIEYALSQAVQKVENGESIVNLKIWHETHNYFPLGKVSVVKVEGDIIKYNKK